MPEDQVIARIREARHQISEECGHDARRLVDYYKELQKRHKDRIWREDERKESTDLVKA